MDTVEAPAARQRRFADENEACRRGRGPEIPARHSGDQVVVWMPCSPAPAHSVRMRPSESTTELVRASMIGAGREVLRNAWYLTALPGIAILLTVLALNLVGDGLNDALNPRLKSG